MPGPKARQAADYLIWRPKQPAEQAYLVARFEILDAGPVGEGAVLPDRQRTVTVVMARAFEGSACSAIGRPDGASRTCTALFASA